MSVATSSISVITAPLVLYSVGNGIKSTLENGDKINELELSMNNKRKNISDNQFQLQIIKEYINVLYGLQSQFNANQAMKFDCVVEFWKDELVLLKRGMNLRSRVSHILQRIRYDIRRKRSICFRHIV